MPNPSGVNNFNKFAPEPAYGDKLRQDTLERSAPVPANPAMNAPRRAQKAAGKRAAQQAPAPVAPAQAEAPNPQLKTAQELRDIAMVPGASDLVKFYAARAQSGS